MSSTITTKIPLRSLRSQITTSSRRNTIAVQQRRFFFNSFWRSHKPAEHAHWSPATHGPFRPTKRQEQLQQEQEQALRQSKEQELLIRDEFEIGQLDGGPAKKISVNIDGERKIFDAVFLRDSCTCTQCMDPDSKNKLFQTSDIPEDLEGSCKAVVDQEQGECVSLQSQIDVIRFGP